MTKLEIASGTRIDMLEWSIDSLVVSGDVLIGGDLTVSGAVYITLIEYLYSDLYLDSDGAAIKFGDDQEVTLTHVHNDGLIINDDMQLQFRDSGLYIYSSADSTLDIVSDSVILLKAESEVLVYDDDGNSTLIIRSYTDDAVLNLDSGDDGTSENSRFKFLDNRTVKWQFIKTAANDLVIYDDIGNQNVMTFTTGTPPAVLLTDDAKFKFRDSAIYINSSADTVLDIVADGYVDFSTPDVRIDQKLSHAGDPDTYIEFVDDKVEINAGGIDFIQIVEGASNFIEFNADKADVDFYFYNDTDATLFIDGSTSPYIEVNTDKRLRFRDSAIYIRSDADGDMLLVADDLIQFQAENGLLVYDNDGNSIITIRSFTDDALLYLDSGDDGTPAESEIQFQDDRTTKWKILKATDNSLIIYDYAASEALMTFATGTPSTITLFEDTELRFRDGALSISSNADGSLSFQADTTFLFISPTTLFDYGGSGDVAFTIRSEQDDVILTLDSGDDGTPEQSILKFSDDRTAKWLLYKDSSQNLVFYDDINNNNVLVFNGATATFYNDPIRMDTNNKLEFRDADIFIYSDADGQMYLSSDGNIQLEAPNSLFRNFSGDATVTIRSGTDDGVLVIDSGDDATTEESWLKFQDDRTDKWSIYKDISNQLILYDHAQTESLLTFVSTTPSTITVFEDTQLRFRDAGIYINSSPDGQMNLVCDGSIVMDTQDAYVWNDVTGNAQLIIRSNADDAVLQLDSGDDSTSEESILKFLDDRVLQWALFKNPSNDLVLRNEVNSDNWGYWKLVADPYLVVNDTSKICFRDTALYIHSDADGDMLLVADDVIQFQAEGGVLIYDDDGDSDLIIRSNTDDANLSLDSGGDATPEYSRFKFMDDGVSKWHLYKDNGNTFHIYDYANTRSNVFMSATAAYATRVRFGDKNGAADADDFYTDPTAGNGMEGFVYDYSNDRVYWYGNGGVHYTTQDGGFAFGPDHEHDPITGKKFEEGDLVLMQIDRFYTDGVPHAVPVSLDSVIEKKVEEKLKALGVI